MISMVRENREENERQLLALLLNKNDMINGLVIKPSYLHNPKNVKLLDDIIKCYQETGVANIPVIYDKIDKLIDIDYATEIYTDVFYYNQACEEQLSLAQDMIVQFYKEDFLNGLTKELEAKKIDYEVFQKKVKALNDIQVNTRGRMKKLSKDAISKIEDRTYIKSGILELDHKLHGFALGELSVWSGGNASAKSTFLNQVAIEAINQGYKVAIYSGELTDKRLANWLILQCAGHHNVLKNDSDYYYVPDEKKEKIYEWFKDKLFVYDNDYGNNSQDVISSIEDCVKTNGVKVVVIDNLMSLSLGSADDKYGEQTKLITKLSSLAKKYNIHIHFICHPRKTTTFLRKNDISGTGDLTNIADNVFILHRVNNDFKVKIKEMFPKIAQSLTDYTNIIEVCKNREFGIEDCFIGLYFDLPSRRLLNYTQEDKKYSWENKYIDL